MDSVRSTYRTDQTLLQAREHYFDRYGFDNGGYDDRWVKLMAGPIPIVFPNIPVRVVAVRYHDLHHVVTEYPANWVGESEIGAWEIASGCRHHWPAWILNLGAMAIGLVLAPGKVWSAFHRGRHTGNLYALPFDDALLATTVGNMRRQLRLDLSLPQPTPADRIAFLLWSAIAIATVSATPLALSVAVLWLAFG